MYLNGATSEEMPKFNVLPSSQLSGAPGHFFRHCVQVGLEKEDFAEQLLPVSAQLKVVSGSPSDMECCFLA